MDSLALIAMEILMRTWLFFLEFKRTNKGSCFLIIEKSHVEIRLEWKAGSGSQ